MSVAICFGEVVIDHFPGLSLVGGAPLNVAARLSRLGWTVYLLSRVGADPAGDSILETASRHNVSTDLIRRDIELSTGSVTVSPASPDADKFVIEHPSAWDNIEVEDGLPSHDVLYYGTLVARTDSGRDALGAILSASSATRKVCDVNLRLPWAAPTAIDTALKGANIVKCSREELAMISLGGVDELFNRYPGVRLVAVTAGPMGAAIYRPRSELHAPAPEVTVVDAVGAGDAFTAGLIDGEARNLNDTEILRHATAIASEALQSEGGLPLL